MELTSDQYIGLSKLEKWYRKYSHQVIEISGVIGTGTWDLVQAFIELSPLDPREVMYLSYDQKQVVELASKRYHSYYINNIIYNYNRIVNFDSLYVINPRTTGFECKWEKEVRKKVDKKYKLIVVFDSMLLSERTLHDLLTFGLPIILIRDPMLTPVPDTYTFMRDPNIRLRDLHPEYARNPLVYFASKILIHDQKISFGNYDNVTVVPKKQMNLYNMKSADMIITLSDELRNQSNKVYRERILKQRTAANIVNEKVIIMNNMYGHRLVNKDEKRLKIYLTKGTVGYITKINKHALVTRYVPFEFRPEFYFDSFDDLYLDRYYLNHLDMKSRQAVPDEFVETEYAYALTPQLARLSHWNKVTMIVDYRYDDMDQELLTRLLYTGITRATETLTLVM